MDGVHAMTTTQVLNAITELVHAMRPGWDRAGIYAACHSAAATRPLDQVAHAAIAAAMDPTARTPAVILMRDRAWQPTLGTELPPPPTHEPRQPDDVTRRGSANARQALAKARARVDDDANDRPPPRS